MVAVLDNKRPSPNLYRPDKDEDKPYMDRPYDWDRRDKFKDPDNPNERKDVVDKDKDMMDKKDKLDDKMEHDMKGK